MSESRVGVPNPEDLAFESVTVDGWRGRPPDPRSGDVPPAPAGISVVLGASGAGKTTLLRLCNRLEVPSSVQLVLVGWALHLVLDPSRPLAWAFAWVAAMIVFAAFTVRQRASEVPAVFPWRP